MQCRRFPFKNVSTVLCDSRQLASGSGDTTVRFWDVFTETPLHTCKAHKHWILCIAWSPDGKKLASGCKSGQVQLLARHLVQPMKLSSVLAGTSLVPRLLPGFISQL